MSKCLPSSVYLDCHCIYACSKQLDTPSNSRVKRDNKVLRPCHDSALLWRCSFQNEGYRKPYYQDRFTDLRLENLGDETWSVIMSHCDQFKL